MTKQAVMEALLKELNSLKEQQAAEAVKYGTPAYDYHGGMAFNDGIVAGIMSIVNLIEWVQVQP